MIKENNSIKMIEYCQDIEILMIVTNYTKQTYLSNTYVICA